MYLGLVETCNDIALAGILQIIQRVMLIFQIIVPIIAIIALIKTLVKLTMDPENKKMKGAIKNWILSILIFFFLPVIINLVMGLLDNQFNLTTCWNYAKNNSNITEKTDYIEDYNPNYKVD